MGFFSQDCEGCGHPALSIQATNPVNRWMNQCVVITELGSVLKGEYDGYGRLEGDSATYDFVIGGENTVWHKACWNFAGKPMDYRGASTHSADQGWFFDDRDHNMKEPIGANN